MKRSPPGALLSALLFLLVGADAGRHDRPALRAGACPAPGSSSALAISYAGIQTRLSVSSAFLLPGDTLTLAVNARRPVGPVVVHASTGALSQLDASHWRWEAPRNPGNYALEIVPDCGADSLTVRAFVMVPDSAVQQGILNGFRIGQYPKAPARRPAIYRPPAGFVEVTPHNQDLFVTPHFQLKQFLTKQPGGFPKYVVLDSRLLLKLEYILGLVQAAGYGSLGFHVMSGYRTPAYNRALGNVPYSRHLYGAAADIFIDEHPKDGVMDDLNGDGRIDVRDAAVLYALIDRHAHDLTDRPMLGGLAMYPSTQAHGPFVHVDVRGYSARW
jgi:hypothetical protein